jgi:CRISPR-associated endoribonuclease Cas6
MASKPTPAKKAVLQKIDPSKTAHPKTAPSKKDSSKTIPKKPNKKTNNALNRSARSLWPKSTELVSLKFTLQPAADCELYAQYSIGLHAWFLQQIQTLDADLSAYLHNGESEKPFSLTGLSGQFTQRAQTLQLNSNNTYHWNVCGLSQRVVQGIAAWLKQLPDYIDLNNAPLSIKSVHLAQPATTYKALLKQGKERASQTNPGSINLSFVSPTSFRRKGHHLPLPWPTNVFHSYLRRWNHFAPTPVDPDDFLSWLDQHIIIQRHQLESVKVAAGKQGSVTGFTGAIAYSLDRKAAEQANFHALFYALAQLAPYCGTGHKTTFGLGETQLGWHTHHALADIPSAQQVLAQRIEELTDVFLAQRKRQGGNRAQNTAETWATILARREQGDDLSAIAQDMELPYETAKTYSKLARKAMKAAND